MDECLFTLAKELSTVKDFYEFLERKLRFALLNIEALEFDLNRNIKDDNGQSLEKRFKDELFYAQTERNQCFTYCEAMLAINELLKNPYDLSDLTKIRLFNKKNWNIRNWS